ncbi:MAG: HAD family hydrolase [Acidimicrobiia bacterium]|nr:HAD family hydrolase [Acidimicrobiia bacterium]
MPRLHDVGAALLASVQGIVFDKDGTLADLERRWVPFFRGIISWVAQSGGDPEAGETLAAVLGVGASGLVPGSPAAVKSDGELLSIAVAHLTERGWEADKAVAAIVAGVESTSFGPLVPLGDVAGSMATLGRGYHLGVATSDRRVNTLDELTELGIADLISALHCGDDGQGVKPEPTVLWRIADGWKLDPARVLFVGDSSQDLDTARAAGCPFVAVDPNPTAFRSRAAESADAWVASIDELVATRPRSV